VSEGTAGLRRKIDSAGDLKSVVRSMKALAAASIGQYERAVAALGDYDHSVTLGLSVALRAVSVQQAAGVPRAPGSQPRGRVVRAIVFGSDQGLVGRFNERVAEHAHATLATMQGAHDQPAEVWAVGERVHDRLADAGLRPRGLFQMPGSVQVITPLVGQILTATVTASGGVNATPADSADNTELHLFHNRPGPAAGWAPVCQRLLPLDSTWRAGLLTLPWPGTPLPELLGHVPASVGALLREHVFVSLFRACAESLASENASRLAAMERADRNIEDLLLDLNASFHRRRQSGIDAELFDVIAGFDALSVRHGRHVADAA